MTELLAFARESPWWTLAYLLLIAWGVPPLVSVRTYHETKEPKP